MPRGKLIQLRRDTAADWASADPVLADGEPGWDETNGIIKVGDGSTAWSALTSGFQSGDISTPTLWLRAADFAVITGSVVQAVAPANAMSGWLFDAAATERLVTAWVVPDGWSSATVTFYWANAGAGAGDVQWIAYDSVISEGSDMATAPSLISVATDTAGLQNVVVTSTTTAVNVTAGSLRRLRVDRNATAGADTLANDAALYGVMLAKAS